MTEPKDANGGMRRLALALGGAIVLFGIGAGLYSAGIFTPIRQVSVRAGDKGEEIARNETDRREAYEKALKAYSKDPKLDPPALPVDADGYFIPKSLAHAPDDQFGASVRRGYEIFVNTQTAAADYAGNGMNCRNCHLDAGKLANSAPMWAAAVQYPAWRGKNKMINTMQDRVHGCFTYSMNAQGSLKGEAPGLGSDIYKDLESYFYFLAEGAPLDGKLPGRGYPVPPKSEQGYDVARGETVFKQNCAVCHGEQGEGRQDRNGRWVFPALWGDDSYNWGAGMHRIDTAAGFIKANMPLSKRYSLSDQEAWDVAAYINSFERPPDPRQIRDGISLAEAHERYHKNDASYYAEEVNGDMLGDGVPGESEEQPPVVKRMTIKQADASPLQ